MLGYSSKVMNAGVRVWLEAKQSTSVRSAVFYMQEHVHLATAVI